jgi:peptidoglycan/xylan/chitin deacetylase (PgdA/CDA1 family)
MSALELAKTISAERHRRRAAAGRVVVAAALATLALWAGAAAAAGDWAVVLVYHRFGEDRYPGSNIRLSQFEAHLREIGAGGYSVLAVPEIVRRLKAGETIPDKTLGITVNDAYLSVYQEAWPRLEAAGLPFTLFVATDRITQGEAGFMTWEQIRELHQAGVTIGHQTASHPHMVAAGPDQNAVELRRANARFEAELGVTPTLFAYPYGEFSREVRDQIAAAGFAAGFAQTSGVAHAGQDFYALPRFTMTETFGGIERFRLVGSALPLPVKDVVPVDTLLGRNPPVFGFTIDRAVDDVRQLACFVQGQGRARIERLGARRVEVRLSRPLAPGRSRINCTMPGPNGRWRWFGTQFVVPGN